VALLAAVAIAGAVAGPSLGGSSGPGRASVPVIPTERLAAGPYLLSITRSAAGGGERAEVRITDAAGSAVAGKPVTGLLVYEGNAPGHEHHDILISREAEPGIYTLDLREAIAGPWLLTIVVGDEARAGYLFTVR
jgi:hypothetical protein